MERAEINGTRGEKPPWVTWEVALEMGPLAAMDSKPFPCRVSGAKCKLAGDTETGALGLDGNDQSDNKQSSAEQETVCDTTLDCRNRPNPLIRVTGDGNTEPTTQLTISDTHPLWREGRNRPNGKYPVTQANSGRYSS